MDPALFFYFEDGSDITSNIREIKRVLGSHVDNNFSTGNKDFHVKIREPLKKRFEFGSESSEPSFKYVGINIRQEKDGFVIDQEDYLRQLNIPSDKFLKDYRNEDVSNEQKFFRSITAKFTMLSLVSRPDL